MNNQYDFKDNIHKKYNPDVNDNFIKIKNDINLNNIQYSKHVWKGITGDEFNKDIKGSTDFKIDFEKPNINTIMEKHNIEFLNREKEMKQIEIKNNLIRQAALEDTMVLDIPKLINNNDNNDIKTHNELRNIKILDNDVLKNEKEKFNSILKDLDFLF
jgi:hypothetical protein